MGPPVLVRHFAECPRRGEDLPRFEPRARVFEGSGASVVIYKVAHPFTGVFHLPARG